MLEVMKMTLMVVVKMMVMRQFDHYNDDDDMLTRWEQHIGSFS